MTLSDLLHPCHIGIISPNLTELFILRVKRNNVQKVCGSHNTSNICLAFSAVSWVSPTSELAVTRQVNIIFSYLCMEVRKTTEQFLLFSCSCFLILYFLTILSHRLVASQIKLHRKDNNPVQTLLFFSPLNNLEEGKIFYGSWFFLSVTCILSGSVFIVISFTPAIFWVK
jgi:hypothetical protein